MYTAYYIILYIICLLLLIVSVSCHLPQVKKTPQSYTRRLIGDSTRRFQNETAWNNKNGFIGGLKGFYVSKVGGELIIDV